MAQINNDTAPSTKDVVALFRTILKEKSAVYLSVPITSGPRFQRWYHDEGSRIVHDAARYRSEHYSNVIAPNRDWFRKRINDLRSSMNGNTVIDPTAFEFSNWSQNQFRSFWAQVINEFVSTIVFLDGWQFSTGCANEFLVGARSGLRLLDEHLEPIKVVQGLELLDEALLEIRKYDIPTDQIEEIVNELKGCSHQLHHQGKITFDEKPNKISFAKSKSHFKDEVLDQLARVANIAQFVSFEPTSLSQRYSRIQGFEPNFSFSSAEVAVSELLQRSPDGTVNVRSFRAELAKGEPLHYGLDSLGKVMKVLYRNSAEGKYSIVNETINTGDGGVSGVGIGDIVEFAPNDTPQCVDKPGVCALPRNVALSLLNTVYGFRPAINFGKTVRVEFSIHPQRRGLRGEHTIIWELEEVGHVETDIDISWPNNFSKVLGDKAFGLLLGHSIGLKVPRSTVISRTIAPFLFGTQTYTKEFWMRTCPAVPSPGQYPTTRGWQDPFKILADLDSKGHDEQHVPVVSILAQESVQPDYSGSMVPTKRGKDPGLIIEGVRGPGDLFMVGKAAPESLPESVKQKVSGLYECASARLGAVNIEWVYDGEEAWLIQIHKAKLTGRRNVIHKGKATSYCRFDVRRGLEELRNLVPTLRARDEGVILVGDIGVTSHYGDILRSAKIPSKIERTQLSLFDSFCAPA